MNALPGGPISSRPLHFIWILDVSGSMMGDKIQALNFAINETIKPMQATALQNPHAQVLVRAVTFSDSARWHITTPTPVADFKWADVSASGLTSMGKALTLVAEQLHIPPMSDRALPPVLVLISDGAPTDDFSSGLKKLMAEPWGQRAVRLAIGVGRKANLDVLSKFIGHPELLPLEANSSAALVNFIKWASTAVLQSASSPASQAAAAAGPGAAAGGAAAGGVGANVQLPAMPQAPPTPQVW